MVKDGQLDKLKEFILASFQAGQQPRPHQVECCPPSRALCASCDLYVVQAHTLDLSLLHLRTHTPRTHTHTQWEAVFKIVQDLLQPVENLESEAMKNFLLQHSTGSGKSLTIACLTYCLYLLRVTLLFSLSLSLFSISSTTCSESISRHTHTHTHDTHTRTHAHTHTHTPLGHLE
jgi:hypothetical protein